MEKEGVNGKERGGGQKEKCFLLDVNAIRTTEDNKWLKVCKMSN